MTDVMKAQVGGTHYSSMGMQPFEFTVANRYDPLAHTILKYVARHASKNGKVDLEKARHCVGMRLKLLESDAPTCLNCISIQHFISINRLPEPEAKVLTDLHYWTMGWNRPDIIYQHLDQLIAARYPNEEQEL